MLHSAFTLNKTLQFEYADATKYLYFNGALQLSATRLQYLEQGATKTTICNHLRLLHFLSWYESKEIVKLILYCITDSKAIVGYLRNAQSDPNFDIGWWQLQSFSALNPYEGGDDSFFSSKIPFKNKDVQIKDLIAMKDFLESTIAPPRIYLAYATLFKIFRLWRNHHYFNDLLITTLECVHFRRRLDRRALELETQKS